MYIGVDWETVNSIQVTYTSINVPNLETPKFFLMYYHVYWCTNIITCRWRPSGSIPPYAVLIATASLAGGLSFLRLAVFDEVDAVVLYGPAEFNKAGAIPREARFGEP